MINNNTQTRLGHNSSTNRNNHRSMASEVSENHILIIEDDQGRKEFSLSNPVYSIGRDKNCNIRLFSQFISRHHATLVRLPRKNNQPGYYYRIVDGDSKGKPSSNGILINGRKLPAHDLKNEDEVVFGPHVKARYYLLKEAEDDPSEEIETDITEWDITLINPGMNEEEGL